MININSLSTSEVIRYADNGSIDAIPSYLFLKILQEYQDQINAAESEKSQQGYDNGYDDGWEAAIADVKEHLRKM